LLDFLEKSLFRDVGWDNMPTQKGDAFAKKWMAEKQLFLSHRNFWIAFQVS
jgi:hypothetical protein